MRRPRRRRRGFTNQAMAVILLPLVAVVIFIVLFSRNGGNGPEPQPRPANYQANTPAANNPGSQTLPDNNYPDSNYPAQNNTANDNGTIPIQLTNVPVRYLEDTGYLALVNRQHPVQTMPYQGLINSVWPTVAVSRIDGMYLHSSALRAVSEMFATARQHDIASFFVSSGFRSYDAQAYLYGDGSNSAFVQPPGHSEHHTGLAADILAPGVGMAEMGNTPEGKWLAANSYRYGLILRYPEGATAITGIAFEPWHFRYVGRVHAYFMKRNNLVLEEYIALIHNYGHISFEKGGQTFYVMHKVPESGMIYVPYGLDFVVSGDNKGGFIVKAWA